VEGHRVHAVVRCGLMLSGYLRDMLRCSFDHSVHLLIPRIIIPE
jgi:hypothetical protein